MVDKERVPLFVDVDGTLTRADISLESFVAYARRGVFHAMRLVLWLIAGRAFAKTMVARDMRIDPARLPYRQEVLDLIAAARAEGRPVILASASHWTNIRRIARHLDLNAWVIGTRGRDNRKARGKLLAIRQALGEEALFDYIGDSRADLCLWSAARRGWTVGHEPRSVPVGKLAASPPSRSRLRILLKAMRPHQWSKNGLVLVPLFTSGMMISPLAVLKALAAMLCMSLIASSIYLLNDMLDIDADRAHRTKYRRPIAHGDLSIPAAAGLSALLGIIGLAGGLALGGWPLAGVLAAYILLTCAYSFRLKAVMVADVIALASLYTVRLWVGAVAIGVPLSFWLLLFSVFLFLSLAYLKRYIELRDVVDDPLRLLKGRGYVPNDLQVVMVSGVAAGIVSILVLALFANDLSTAHAYKMPHLLWLICLPLLYWINRIWMMAWRGEVDGDPVAFAVRDPYSIIVGIICVALFVAAQRASLPV